jgi:hypothetical protein
MPIDIVAGLSLAKNALDIVKAVREAHKQKKLTSEEMRDYLDTLQDKLVDVKTALSDADEEIRNLKRQLEEATRKADFGASFKSEHGVYWRDGFPYCPICWDNKRQPTRLSGPDHVFPAGPGMLLWNCSVDKGQFPLPRFPAK